jgi:hypothetical protein
MTLVSFKITKWFGVNYRGLGLIKNLPWQDIGLDNACAPNNP